MRHVHWREVFLVTALLCVSSPSFAEPAADEAVAAPPPAQKVQEPAPTDVKTFGDWTVRCFPIKSLGQCDMLQATLDKATGRRIISTSIAYVPSTGRYVAKIIVPLGVKIAAGIAVTSDKYKSKALAISRCENDGCYVEEQLDAVLVGKLIDGKTGSIVVALTSGRPVALPLSMRGFSDAVAEMKDLAIQKSR
jgi:invasion protein IalB